MNALSVYSGGCDGMSLAASWFDIKTVAFCEIDEACRYKLAEHHPGKPIFKSDEKVTLHGLRNAGIDPGTIDGIFGGPPCQPVSTAGKRIGWDDPRNRWPEFIRIIREVGPRWFVAENPPGIVTANDGWYFREICRRFSEAGYRYQWQCWSAFDVGASQGRERLFLMGYANGGKLRNDFQNKRQADREINPSTDAGIPCRTGNDDKLANAGGSESQRGERRPGDSDSRIQRQSTRSNRIDAGRKESRSAESTLGGSITGLPYWLGIAAQRLEETQWPHPRYKEGVSPQYDWEPPRVVESFPNRAKELEMLGNACPPQQYAPAFAAIAQAEPPQGASTNNIDRSKTEVVPTFRAQPKAALCKGQKGTSVKWIKFSEKLPPENVLVMTKIDDEHGVRNQQPLMRKGGLMFLVNDSMYVYYAPTHWKPSKKEQE